MNQLTAQGRRNYQAEERANTLYAVGCGFVFAALFISFLL
jgi:hypothetical protein